MGTKIKKTVEVERWTAGGLVDAAAGKTAVSCEIGQLISFLSAVADGVAKLGLENIRLEDERDYDENWLVLLGERDETTEEAAEREAAERSQERSRLLRQLSEQALPKKRHQREDEWRTELSVLIQQRGWDRMTVEELRELVHDQ